MIYLSFISTTNILDLFFHLMIWFIDLLINYLCWSIWMNWDYGEKRKKYAGAWNNFESVLHVQSMGIDTSSSFHHYFHCAHLLGIFNSFSHSHSLTVDSQREKIENRKEKRKKRKIEWNGFILEEKGCLYYLEIIFTNSKDIFIYLNHNPKVF